MILLTRISGSSDRMSSSRNSCTTLRNAEINYQLAERGSGYRFVRRTLVHLGHHGLRKGKKGRFTRPIRRHRETGQVEDGRGTDVKATQQGR